MYTKTCDNKTPLIQMKQQQM